MSGHTHEWVDLAVPFRVRCACGVVGYISRGTAIPYVCGRKGGCDFEATSVILRTSRRGVDARLRRCDEHAPKEGTFEIGPDDFVVRPKYDGRGGARAGAGRKAKSPTGEARTEPIPAKVSPSELAVLKVRAVSHDLDFATYVRTLLGLEVSASEQRCPKEQEPK